MKIAVVQFAPVLGQPARTRELVSELIEKTRGVDLVVLPELANSGYAFASEALALSAAEPVHASPFIEMLTRFAKDSGMHVVTGLNERDEDRIFNSAVLLGPEGKLGVYRKLHLFNSEKLYFTPGDCVSPVFQAGNCRIGLAICFDWIFPEVWRVLALRGADLVCHPSNLVIPGNCQRAVPVHAMINRIYIATANRVGREGDLEFTGRSQIVDPRGRVLAEAAETGEQILEVTLDPTLARDKQVTERNDALADRRPEAYGL